MASPLVSVQADTLPTLTTPLKCWIVAGPSDLTFPVSGISFPVSNQVLVGYRGQTWPFATTQTDAAGNFTAHVPPAQTLGDYLPIRVTIQAAENNWSQILASLPVRYVARAMNDPYFASFTPASHRVVWRFGGFPHATIYAHYLFNRYGPIGRYQYVATKHIGRTTGPCGTLHARRAPFRGIALKNGSWKIQFDDRRRYEPAATISMQRCLEVYLPHGRSRYVVVNAAPCGLP